MVMPSYSSFTYRITPFQRSEWAELKPWLPLMQWLAAVGMIGGLVWLGQQAWWLYPVALLFIAGRAGVLLQLVHEATHTLLVRNHWNDRLGDWFCAAPLGLNLAEYRYGHLRHHAFVGTTADPEADTEKYRVCDIRRPELWWLFLKDLSGWTAIQTRVRYGSNFTRSTWQKYARIAVVQVVILALFRFNLLAYWLFWIVPLTTVHMALMRVRGIGEHGLWRQMGADAEEGQGTFYTRSCAVKQSWMERCLIGSLNVGYHHEHHLVPFVPYYTLPEVYARLHQRITEKNPAVYLDGYLSSLIRPWRQGWAVR